MRNQFQIRVRQNKAAIANDLLNWLKEAGGPEASYAFELVIKPFAAEKKLPLFLVWQAWDLLKKAGRRDALPGSHWRIVSFEPIVLDEKGDVRLSV